MRTEARFLLAVLLMLVVLIGTNRLFPPIVPEEGVVPDSLGSDTVAEVVPTPPPSLPDLPGAEPPRVPVAEPEEDVVVGAPAAAPAPAEQLVTVEGPLYRFTFPNVGARMLSAELRQFQALNHGGRVDLVPEQADGYLSHKLVVGSDTVDVSRVPFRVEPEEGLELTSGGSPKTLRYVYEHPSTDFAFQIAYTFDPDLYIVGVRGEVRGLDDALLVTDLGEGLAFAEADSAQEARLMAYVRNHLQDGIDATSLAGAEPTIVGGPLRWAAFKSKFFVLALLAGESDETATDASYLGGLIVTGSEMEDRVRIGAAQTVGNDGGFAYRLFIGPQEYARLSSLGQDLEEVNPYGWRFFRPIIRPIVSIILTILVFLHTQLTWGYGWVLVFFGVMMRIVLWPLNHKAMKAQLRNMAVQPLIQEIQKKYKDQPEKLQKEMLRLHKEHGFNPLAGCLPMLLPWPVLIALFFVFQNTIELRGVNFLWLPDLSAKDPYFILPVLLAISMFLMQWVSLRSLDAPNPQMKMMMYIMPPMMLVIFSNLASGLNLYYATANLATVPQQIWIAKERKKMRGKPPPKLSSE
jgi:YidC/Oxa1 family membrane protein insertase